MWPFSRNGNGHAKEVEVDPDELLDNEDVAQTKLKPGSKLQRRIEAADERAEQFYDEIDDHIDTLKKIQAKIRARSRRRQPPEPCAAE